MVSARFPQSSQTIMAGPLLIARDEALERENQKLRKDNEKLLDKLVAMNVEKVDEMARVMDKHTEELKAFRVQLDESTRSLREHNRLLEEENKKLQTENASLRKQILRLEQRIGRLESTEEERTEMFLLGEISTRYSSVILDHVLGSFPRRKEVRVNSLLTLAEEFARSDSMLNTSEKERFQLFQDSLSPKRLRLRDLTNALASLKTPRLNLAHPSYPGYNEDLLKQKVKVVVDSDESLRVFAEVFDFLITDLAARSSNKSSLLTV